jgi:CHAT domain-containing protein
VLKATGEELRAIAVTAGSKPIVTLTTSSAKASTLEQELPKAAFAHFATHGFFAAKELQAERQRERRRLRDWQTGSLSADARLTAGRSPLGFTGLVLSRGEVMTGLSLINLPLENLKLVTLSACETGLGELTAGEGVQGLQRAFHLAGCPNVVASLWNVNDSATAALMAKFYHELWVNKRPPIEALREAQLLIYRRPELIADLAGERGAPKLKEAVKTGEPGASLTGGNAAIEKRKHADTKLWAAFVLSGVGR